MNGLTRRGAICCLGCFSALGFRAEAGSDTRPDFEFREIAPGVYRHTSWKTLPNGAYFPSNGMVVVGARRALMIDTAWTPDQTEILLGLLSPIVGTRPIDLFITHFHDDRMGGIGVTARRGIVSHAFEGTVHEAARAKAGDIERALAAVSRMFDLGDRAVEAFYPGAGHTVDNAVAYDARSRVLFGGCMIRAAAATDMGNTADAVLAQWPVSVARTAERFPQAKVVIPGHGESGDRGLFAHTIALARAAG
jgi:metallo-beta-lactamase class B